MARPKGAISKNRVMPAERLREAIKPVFEKLSAAGVPDDKMPSNNRIVGLLPSWIDEAKVDSWVARYVANRVAPRPRKKTKAR